MPSLISPEQSAFVYGRRISDNILIVQEILHSLEQALKRKALMLAKVDMERAYDRLNWDYLLSVLQLMNFPPTFIAWIAACITKPKFAVLVNGAPFEWFHYSVGS